MKDWTGSYHSVFANISTSNHSDTERELNDYYATPPYAVEELLKRESFSHYICEPSVGGGAIAEVLKAHGHQVQSFDIIDRGYPGTVVKDFFTVTKEDLICSPDFIGNPPYALASPFIEHALDISMDSVKIAMFLKIQFLETKQRYELFKRYPPKVIYVFVDRVACGKNGVFEDNGSAVCYAWFVWERGSTSEPIIRWIGTDSKPNKKLF